MAKIRLDTNDIKTITLFESITGANVKDCLATEEGVAFIVAEGDMGLAIGKGGANIERMRNAFGKNVVVAEASSDPATFIANLFAPVAIKNVVVKRTGDEKTTAVIEVAARDRSRVVGRDGHRIKLARKIAQRHGLADDIAIKRTEQ